jgi:hypothetical protein
LRCWNRMEMRTTSVLPSNLVPALCGMPRSRCLLPQLGHQAREPVGPDPHLEGALLHVDPLDPERRCMDKQAEKIANQLRSALE